uniref:Uncharacterized protein n=1 Tax=Vespula pensylvanica TaxID=30213 RepID=A0A834P182_VESPE|nr:hypothetical protein H0235_009072 [Vespula pensylvanica]
MTPLCCIDVKVQCDDNDDDDDDDDGDDDDDDDDCDDTIRGRNCTIQILDSSRASTLSLYELRKGDFREGAKRVKNGIRTKNEKGGTHGLIHARHINMNSCSVALEAYRYSAHVACSSQATGTNYLRYESTKNLLWVDKQQGERSPSLLHQQPVTSTKNLRIAPLDGYKHLICIETRLTLAIKRSTPRNSGQFSITKMANLESFHSDQRRKGLPSIFWKPSMSTTKDNSKSPAALIVPICYNPSNENLSKKI